MVGGSMEKPLGAISYVNAFTEVLEQSEEQGIEINAILHPTGSGSTQAGLAVGAKSLKEDVKILGISVSDDTELVKREVLTIAQDTVQSMDLEIVVEMEDLIVLDEYIQEGYGVLNKDVAEAVRLMSEKEGIFLDPVYTGKAMVALIDLTKKEFFRKEDNVLFLHTGGTPALFPNKHKLVDFLK
jgi:1-aminocyclopropane-1-carboxylate deaminase/D-cysteine desulfhydrase-like pyridoxal-dependent ACC family enzyme